LRAECCGGLEFLGVRLDAARNEAAGEDRLVSADDAPVSVFALATNEELVVARRVYGACTARAA
jgi:acetate kinase